MNIYDTLYKCLTISDIDTKEYLTNKIIEYCNIAKSIEDNDIEPQIFKTPSYASICTIVPSKKLPKRRDLASDEGLAMLLHSIAHIEYSAIDLALDAVYRYRDMPKEFILDWLDVASDEIRHFKMLNEILKNTGYKYGDFPVHSSLFDISMETAPDILERMAVIPRHYEATGLDVNPKIVAKLKRVRETTNIQDTIKALDTIYKEEISHVFKGDRWFKYVCKLRGVDEVDTFFTILRKYDLLKPRDINTKARLKAGFACEELKIMGAKSC